MKEIFFDIFMAFGPPLNYLFQVFKFNKTKSSKGFSKYLCLVTILSHTFKIFYWIIKKFKYTLLIQSILVIIMQLYLIYLCIKYKDGRKSYQPVPSENISNTIAELNVKQELCQIENILNLKLFWKWDNFLEYYIFYFFIIILLSISHLYFNDYNHYSFTLGLLNLFLEMLCSLPQIIEMYKTKNQKNISKIMVLLWLLGNSIKVYYNIYNKSPMQLIIGAYMQVFFNIILILQIIYYYFMNNSDKEGMLINNSNKLTFDNKSQNDEDIKEDNK